MAYDTAAGATTANPFVAGLIDAYSRMRSRWHTYAYVSHKDRARLLDVGLRLEQNRVDPYEFVQFAAEALTEKHGDLYVNMLASHWLLEEFLKKKDERHKDLQVCVHLMYETLQFEMGKGRSLDEILMDPEISMGALFRFAAAWGYQRYELAKRFEEDARLMITFKPYYRELLSEWLPREWVCTRNQDISVVNS